MPLPIRMARPTSPSLLMKAGLRRLQGRQAKQVGAQFFSLQEQVEDREQSDDSMKPELQHAGHERVGALYSPWLRLRATSTTASCTASGEMGRPVRWANAVSARATRPCSLVQSLIVT